MNENVTLDSTTLEPETGKSGGRGYYGPSPGLKMLQDVGVFLQTYVGGASIVLGLVGNILCFIIFSRKSMRSQNVTIFLRALSVADLLFLITGQALVAWPDTVFNMRYPDHNRVACKIYYIVIPVLRQTSSLLVMGFTIERCFAVVFPLKFRSFTNEAVKKAIYTYIALVVTVSSLYNIHGVILFDVVDGKSGPECDPMTEKSPFFISYIRPWISSVLVTVIPFVVILVCNLLILRQIKISQGFRSKDKDQDGDQLKSLAVMLITVSFLFLFLSLPISLAMFLQRAYPPQFWYGSADARAKSDFMWKFCLVTLYLNSAINFFLYTISGKNFRAELVNMLQWCPCLKKKEKKPMDSSTAGSNKITEATNVA